MPIPNFIWNNGILHSKDPFTQNMNFSNSYFVQMNLGMTVIFQNNSFKVVSGTFKGKKIKRIRISMGKYTEKYLKSQGFDGNVYLNYPKNIGNTNVSEVELSPSKDSNLIWAITKYKKKVKVPPKVESLNNLNKAGVDFGMVNLMTVFSPNIPFPIIYKGGKILYINKHYKNMIEGNQSRLKLINDVVHLLQIPKF